MVLVVSNTDMRRVVEVVIARTTTQVSREKAGIFPARQLFYLIKVTSFEISYMDKKVSTKPPANNIT